MFPNLTNSGISTPTTSGMPLNFLGLPRELRDKVYELCLLHHCHLNPVYNYGLTQELDFGLLRVNRTIYTEASSLLYTRNGFDLTTASSDQVAWFFGTIGEKNAHYIRNVFVDFPSFTYSKLEPGKVILDEDSEGLFACLKSRCVNLRTLAMPLDFEDIRITELGKLTDRIPSNDAFTLADTRLRAIQSLTEIVVEIYEEPSDDIKREMEDLGWMIDYCKQDSSDGHGSDDSDYDYWILRDGFVDEDFHDMYT